MAQLAYYPWRVYNAPKITRLYEVGYKRKKGEGCVERSLSTKALVIGGGPGGRISYMALRRIGEDKVKIVMNEEPTVICSLPYGVGRKLVPQGPEALIVDLSKGGRLPKDMPKDVIHGVVKELDITSKKAYVEGSDGRTMVSFEKLILATGAVPWIPPISGVLLEGPSSVASDGKVTWVMYGNELVEKSRLVPNVYVIRGADDARKLDEFASHGKSAVVVGSGAIGLEMAEALHDRGLQVSVVEVLPHLSVALDADMASWIEKRALERDIKTYIGVSVTNVMPEGVALSDGSTIKADGVLFATGVRPNVALAKDCGLEVERGIVVDSHMRTSHPDVYAVGDAVQVVDAPTGRPILPLIGTLAMRQGLVAAFNIMGMSAELPPVTIWGVSSFFDLHWASIGWSEEAASKAGIPVKTIVLPVRTRDEAMPAGKNGKWKVVVSRETAPGLKEGQIIGFQAVIEGDPITNLSERFLDIITAKESVPEILHHYFAHCPSQNAVDDPYLALFFNYQTSLAG